jgi:aspartyl-tRNA synthetase
MLMAGKETLRDVTAFPKAQSGADPLTGAPAPVPEGALRELGITVIARPETAKDGGA